MRLMKQIAFLLMLCNTQLWAQMLEGEIVYEEVMRWSQVTARMDYLSQEEKDRMKLTWANFDEEKVDMKLVFNGRGSLYTFAKAQREYADGRYSAKNLVYVFHRDFENYKQKDWIESLGRVYYVEDSLQVPKWKIMNKIKDIQGHVCMLAETVDPVKGQKITAWFADDLPVPVGPGPYFGLPGAILELEVNEGELVITAKSVELRAVNEETTPPRKLKGRKVSQKEYDDLIVKHIEDSKKQKRNPFWSMPVL